MYKALQKIIAVVAIVGCICVNAVAVEFEMANHVLASDETWVE